MYPDQEVAQFINSNFHPVKVHIKEQGPAFHRFHALWTPALLVLDSAGAEQFRNEGFLPKAEFLATLKLGLGRVAFQNKKWTDARKWYDEVASKYADTYAGPVGVYWAHVCSYKESGDHKALIEAGQELARRYPDSVWATKASVWLPKGGEQAA